MEQVLKSDPDALSRSILQPVIELMFELPGELPPDECSRSGPEYRSLLTQGICCPAECSPVVHIKPESRGRHDDNRQIRPGCGGPRRAWVESVCSLQV